MADVSDVSPAPTGPHGDAASLARREFFKGAAIGAAALVTGASAAPAPAAATVAPMDRPAAVLPSAAQVRAETGPAPATSAATPVASAAAPPGSDFMVDVLRKLGFEYVAMNPGSAFQGLHESLINYGEARTPEILTCLHEESAVAMAHGYGKAAGKPMLVMVHGTVGLLHASMAVFQAWADRAPLVLIVGQHRNPVTPINRPHSAQDMGALVRPFVKFDDETTTLERFAESAMRAYRIAMTPPRGPTVLVVDAALQEAPVANRAALRIPELTLVSPPQGEAAAVREAARLLVAAERPLILAQRVARTPMGWDRLVELAELVQAPVDVGTFTSWQDFPSWHPLCGSGGAGYLPDVTIGLEVSDLSAQAREARASGAKTISISSEHLYQGSNIHDFGRYADVDLAIAADAEATLPSLVEEVRRLMTPERRRALDARGARIGAAHRALHARAIENARYGWNSRPISVPRLVGELGAQLASDDWAIVSGQQFTGEWQRRLLNFDRHYRNNGDSGGMGIGYDTPASVGAALANRRLGRLSVAIVGDGDLNFGPGVLWTAVHHKIPLLIVVHNNRAYHAEVMIVQRLCGSRGRAMDGVHIGTTLTDPVIDHAALARAYGMYSEGPVDDPDALAGAYARALAKVRAGEPALVDVVAQPR